MRTARLRPAANLRTAAIALAVFSACCCGPASASPAPRCLGKPATIVQRSGDVRGTAHADVIIAGGGSDIVEAGGGNDRICAGSGADRVLGEIGSDVIDAGDGNDLVDGGNGSDLVAGGRGRDSIAGKRGNDILAGQDGARDFLDGGVGDDVVDGGSGDFDQAIGDIGNDELRGGDGDGDVLRGALGRDLLDGGPGSSDTASFTIAGAAGRSVGGRGVEVDLSAGTAVNDGTDRLAEIEDVIGTAFRDRIQGDPGANVIYGAGGDDQLVAVGNGDTAFGGVGSDACKGFAAQDSCEHESPIFGPLPASGAPIEVDVAGGVDATSLTVIVPVPNFLQGAGVSIAVSFEESEWVVRASPLSIAVGGSCSTIDPSEVHCPISGTPDAVLLGGSSGDDRLEVDPTVPSSVSARITGEDGNDVLVGGEGDDTLDGRQGDDVAEGRGGDDALTFAKALDGGAGSDLLIGYPCLGETVYGGAGVDSVSFARAQIPIGIRATIGGTAEIAPDRTGASGFPGGCPEGNPTSIDDSVEAIEGSAYDDILTGDGVRNQLLGRGGDDELLGKGLGDFLVGGSGRDTFRGEGGADRLYARDQARDGAIDCGDRAVRGDVASADFEDPRALNCRLLR